MNYDEKKRQSEIVVVRRAKLSLCTPGLLSSVPVSIALTNARCEGIMTLKTFPAIIVPIIAPKWIKAPRPLKRLVRPHDVMAAMSVKHRAVARPFETTVFAYRAVHRLTSPLQ